MADATAGGPDNAGQGDNQVAGPVAQVVIHQNLHPAPLPPFSGDGGHISVGAFTDAARRAIRSFRMPEDMAAEWIIGALQGAAREEVLDRPAADRTHANQVLDILETTFREQFSALDRLKKFHTRRQAQGESILDYAHGLSALANQANGMQQDAVPAWALQDKFIDGLNSSALRSHLREAQRQGQLTFLQLRDEARRWVVENPEMDTALERMTASTNAELEQLRLTVAALTARLDHQPVKQDPIQQRPSSPPSRHFRCFWCDQAGHREAQCPAKKRYQERQNSGHRGRGRGNPSQGGRGTRRGGYARDGQPREGHMGQYRLEQPQAYSYQPAPYQMPPPFYPMPLPHPQPERPAQQENC